MAKFTEKFKETFYALFEKSGANVSHTCHAMKISRQAYYLHLKEDPEFKLRTENIKEAMIDMVESAFFAKATGGDTACMIFYLKTKGKSRGYVETQQIEVKEGSFGFANDFPAQIESNGKVADPFTGEDDSSFP